MILIAKPERTIEKAIKWELLIGRARLI